MSSQSMKYPPFPANMIECKLIPNFPGYAVSYDYIRAYVWSCWRMGKSQLFMDHWRDMKQSPSGFGYFRVGLWKERKIKTKLIHQLICEAFNSPRPKGMWVLHGVAGKQCNLPSNVYWGTPKQNMADKKRDGTNNHGSRHGHAKLTDEIVIEMFALRKQGLTHQAIADRYDVTADCPGRIFRGERWQHLGLHATLSKS